MTFVDDIRHLEVGIAERVKVAFTEYKASLVQERRYRETVRELSALSGAELADLGIHRSMIKSIAREAALNEN